MQHKGAREGANPAWARAIVAGIWGVLSLLILAPPVLASLGIDLGAAAVYFFFSPVCHQSPDRVFRIFDLPIAVCHRCTGIYWGLFLGAFLRYHRLHRSPAARRNWILAAVIPLAVDALAPYCGLWTNTTWSRLLTGLLFGIVTSSLLLQGITELLAEAPWRTPASGESRLHGGIS